MAVAASRAEAPAIACWRICVTHDSGAAEEARGESPAAGSDESLARRSALHKGVADRLSTSWASMIWSLTAGRSIGTRAEAVPGASLIPSSPVESLAPAAIQRV